MMAGCGKIQLFKFTQKIYQDIGIHPTQSNQNRSSINPKIWFISFCQIQFLISTAAYLLVEANSMIEYGLVFFTCTTVVILIIVYLILLLEMENVLKFIKNFEGFIEKRVHSSTVYKITNEKIERFTEHFVDAVIATFIIDLLFPLFYTIASYYILDLGEKSFFLFLLTWWPIDQKTPFGYLMAWLTQCAGTIACLIGGVLCVNILIGSCWFFMVIADDITNDMVAFNNAVRISKEKDHAKLMERFCNTIQNYSEAKQIINDFNGIFEYSLFAFFSWNILAVSSLLMTLQFQLWDNDSKLFEIMILSMLTLWIFVMNLMFCESGERVTNHFNQFGAEFGQCEWNKLPIEMQRMYLIFLSDTQQPKNIQSYAGIQCTRENFKQITMKGFSYFTTLRNFRE